MKWMKYFSIALVIMMALTACGGGEKKQETQSQQKQSQSKAQSTDKKAAKGGETQSKITTAHYLSEAIEGTDGIKHATVVTKDKDAYVALEMQNKQEPFTEEKKNMIVQRLRTADPEIQNVYISTNVDFNSRLGTMTRDIERGTPANKVNAFFDNLVRNIFPELKR